MKVSVDLTIDFLFSKIIGLLKSCDHNACYISELSAISLTLHSLNLTQSFKRLESIQKKTLMIFPASEKEN